MYPTDMYPTDLCNNLWASLNLEYLLATLTVNFMQAHVRY